MVRLLEGQFGIGQPSAGNGFDTMIAGEIVNGKLYGETEYGGVTLGVSEFGEPIPS